MGEVRQLHPPSGWFHAVHTRDGEALRREGEPFYQYNELASDGEPVLEIQFGDGIWILATPRDLTWAQPAK